MGCQGHSQRHAKFVSNQSKGKTPNCSMQSLRWCFKVNPVCIFLASGCFVFSLSSCLVSLKVIARFHTGHGWFFGPLGGHVFIPLFFGAVPCFSLILACRLDYGRQNPFRVFAATAFLLAFSVVSLCSWRLFFWVSGGGGFVSRRFAVFLFLSVSSVIVLLCFWCGHIVNARRVSWFQTTLLTTSQLRASRSTTMPLKHPSVNPKSITVFDQELVINHCGYVFESLVRKTNKNPEHEVRTQLCALRTSTNIFYSEAPFAVTPKDPSHTQITMESQFSTAKTW